MSKLLFRPESLHSQRQAWLGGIQVMQPIGLNWLIFGVLATLVAAGTFLFLMEWPRTVRLSGSVVPETGWIRLVAPSAGRVVSVHVSEGQQVAAGAPLFTLEVSQARWSDGALLGLRESVETRQRSLDEAKRQAERLWQAQSDGVSQRLAAARRQAAALSDQAVQQKQQLVLAEATLARWEVMARDGFVAESQVQEKQGDVFGRRADGAAIERQRLALNAEIAALSAQEAELVVQKAQRLGEVTRAQAELQEIQARDMGAQGPRRMEVHASVAGQVAAVHVSPGQSVPLDASLGSLRPQSARLAVHLYAPTQAVGLLGSGQDVRLRLPAFPYQKYGWLAGSVTGVAQAPMLAEDLQGLPLARSVPSSEPLYRVSVQLAGQYLPAVGPEHPLRLGMQVEADVVLERRRALEWLFEPLMGWVRR